MRTVSWLSIFPALLLVSAFALAETPVQGGELTPDNSDRHVVMHKNPGCGCCDQWAEHLRDFDFSVEIIEDPKLYDLKDARGIPQPLYSCHTAIVGDYFVEGHVPANDILSLLRLEPEGVTGIAVPGMPLGSPGMEHPRPQSFNTIALLSNGDAYVFAQHAAGEDFTVVKE